MIIVTAGHVDHGKTTLLQAITGINADRLPEEKRRGMTIDLGYAYLPRADESVLGFIDVPGHQKFLANMLAGIGGIAHALLVIAADDGIMAQTQEHLTLLRLAGKPPLTVALTKADRVSSQRIEQVRTQINALLQSDGWNSVTFFVTSTITGSGVALLRNHLLSLNDNTPLHHGPFRLAIDRVFSVKGAGLVVTGTALTGTVNIKDKLWLTGADRFVQIRAIHAQNQSTSHGYAGQRVALNLSGGVSRSDIHRGDWLLTQRPPSCASQHILVALDRVAPVHHRQPLHLHHAASHITGRISLLEPAQTKEKQLAELFLDTPLWLCENDIVMLRDIAAQKTLGAARVLQLQSPRRGKRQPAFLSWLRQCANTQNDAQALERYLARGTLSIAQFVWARQLTQERCNQLLEQAGSSVVGNYALSPHFATQFQQQLVTTLEQFHQQRPEQLGVSRARLRRMALPAEPEPLVYALIQQLMSGGQVINTRGWLHLPQHSLTMNSTQQALWEQTIPLFVDQPWWVRDLATHLCVSEQAMRQLLYHATLLGYLIPIIRDRYYHVERIQQFAELIRHLEVHQGGTSAAAFRHQLGIGRKLAIQILEFFDTSGFTRRHGNVHVLRDNTLFNHKLSPSD